MDNVIIQPGETLKERRLALGLSIEEVADKTRIRREYLVALEHEDYDQLPGTAYVSGFLRNYAGFLELDANQLVMTYLSLRENTTPTETPRSRPEQPSPRRGTHVAVVFLAGILLSGYWIFTSSSNTQQQTYSPTAVSTPTVQQLQIKTTEPAPVTSAPTITEPAIPDPLEIIFNRRSTLELRAISPTKATLTIDERPEQQYDVSQGTILRWKISVNARIHVEDTEQVELYLNKEKIDVLANQVVTLTRSTN